MTEISVGAQVADDFCEDCGDEPELRSIDVKRLAVNDPLRGLLPEVLASVFLCTRNPVWPPDPVTGRGVPGAPLL